MGTNIQVRVNEEQARRVREELAAVRNGLPRATSSAIKKSTDSVRSAIVKGVAANVPIVQSKLYQRGNKRRPIRQFFIGNAPNITGGTIQVRGEAIDAGDAGTAKRSRQTAGRIPIGPKRFGAKPGTDQAGGITGLRGGKRKGKRAGGASWQVEKGGGRKTIPHTFVARMSSGFEGVFKRAGKKRFPLVLLHGPSIPHVALNRPTIQRLLDVDASAIFAKNLDSQVDRLLKRPKAPIPEEVSSG